MQKYKINTKTYKIDSFKLRIPLKDCKVLNPELNSQYQKVLISTGEIIDKINEPTPIFYENNGIKFRVLILKTNIKLPGQKENWINGAEFIQIQPSAKLLKSNYFDGINIKNIRNVYKIIMDLKIFSCSYRTFLKAIIFDIDIAKDKIINITNYKDSLTLLYNAAKENQRYLNLFKQNKNVGLEFNTRKKATPSKPFLKIYHKGLELEYKSTEFYNNYIKSKIKIKDVVRYEATIGNYKHKKRLLQKNIIPEYKTLYQFLTIENNKYKKFMDHSINEYIKKSIKIKSIELTPTKAMLYSMINELIEKGETIPMLQEHAEAYQGSNQRRTLEGISRNKEILNYLIQITLNDDQKEKKIKDNNEVINFIKSLGVEL